MRLRTHLTTALFAMLCSTASAQLLAPENNAPWNGYLPVRLPDAFESIIGAPGTVLVPNSAADDDGIMSMPLDMPFFFIDQVYNPSGLTNGYTLRVGTNGYIGFNGSTNTAHNFTSDLNYSTSTLYPFYNRIIAPYWTDRISSGVTNGGIYYQYSGSTPNRVLTVEWRNRQYDAAPDGSFQAKLFELNGNIEFHYGTGDAGFGTQGTVTTYGVAIGIKNYGQAYGTPSGSDGEKFLLFNDPEVPNVPVTYTRLYVENSQPEIYRYLLSVNGAYWHQNFPTRSGARVSFRASRVQHDVGADSVWFTPARAGNAYAPGSTVTINARFVNLGSVAKSNTPVRADVYLNNGATPISSHFGTAFSPGPTPSQGTSMVTLTPSFGTPLSNFVGEYRVHVYPLLTGDEDRLNDTAKGAFYIVKNHDVTPYAILEPHSNIAPLFQKYPVSVGVPIEIRYLNIGLFNQRDVTVGYRIFNSSGSVLHVDTTVITGIWGPLTFRDISYQPWTPPAAGSYFVQAFTRLATDENRLNDTLPRWPSLGKPFDVRYEIEIAADVNGAHSPVAGVNYAIGRPMKISGTFVNSGVADATNVPVRARIVRSDGTVVYDRTAIVLDIVGGNGRTEQRFPDFYPPSAGSFCVTMFSEYALEPVRSNDTMSWCFDVNPALSGVIRVGFGERFRSIGEARDSMFFYGVAGPVTFELTNDSYTVQTNEITTPALDFRGRVIGLGVNSPVLIRPVASKSMVTIHLKSSSGIGIWYGQRDTSNPSGYITWDGTTRKTLTFTYENTNLTPAQPAYQRSLPFFFGQGASNYTVLNATIEPFNVASHKKQFLTVPMVRYLQSFNEFQYAQDLNLAVSAGIMLRNSAPIDPVIGRNWNNRDTLRNQNNRFENNTIRNFGYGVLSVGAGPLFVVGTGRYTEYSNQNNIYSRNVIENVARAGVMVAFEKGSEVIGNTIRSVVNTTPFNAAYGVAASAGGNSSNNRGYATDLRIEKNRIHDITASNGNASAVLLETAENFFVTPANVVYRFPALGATNHRVWNNTSHRVSAGGLVEMIALKPEATTRIDFVTNGNKVENNTLYNYVGNGDAGAPFTVRGYDNIGVVLERSGTSLRNNIINLEDPNSIGVVIAAPNYKTTVTSDYNAFDVPNGAIGALGNLSQEGYSLPSPQVAMSLNQWRALTGLDMNSVSGDVTREFMSTTPGAENLHIQPNRLGSIVGNRGTVVSGLTQDIDNEPRGASSVGGRYDIGSDEFTGQVRNFDIMAEDVIAPVGYRASTGQYSDAEYVMTDSAVSLRSMVRNVGGQPMTNRTVTMTVAYLHPSNGFANQVYSTQRTSVAVDVAQATTTDFGTWQPRTLREMGLSDVFYGNNPNVTPVYRFTVTSGIDDNTTNNTYSKDVRFYVQRSGREAMVSVENWNAWRGTATPEALSNKLNTDTLMSALTRINWSRADGTGIEDYDLFERDKWPSENLNYGAWTTMIWSQGSEAAGLVPAERAALKSMLNAGTSNFRHSLIIAGQDVARLHDVVLTPTNGAIADVDFVENYLRSDYRGNTNPANYSNRLIKGVVITPGKFEELEPTAWVGDAPPMPSLLRATGGSGIARASHQYTQQLGSPTDSMAGIASSTGGRNVVYYGFDWRHAGRFNFEPDRSGAWRLLLGALDFSQQFRGVLPIELVSFTAYQSGERAVNVEFTTAMETEIASLSVERAVVSNEGTVGEFAVVERLSSRGTATSGADYRVVDRGVDAGGTYVYRLYSTSLDGTRIAEREQTVKLTTVSTGGMRLTVAPNPVRDRATVTVSGVVEPATLELYDDAGRQVRALGVVTTSGTLVLDATDLANGGYTVRVRTAANQQIVERITVTR